MHGVLLSGDGMIIPLKTGGFIKAKSAPHTNTRTGPHHEYTHTHRQSNTLRPTHLRTLAETDTHVKTWILSQTNLLLSGSYEIIKL